MGLNHDGLLPSRISSPCANIMLRERNFYRIQLITLSKEDKLLYQIAMDIDSYNNIIILSLCFGFLDFLFFFLLNGQVQNE